MLSSEAVQEIGGGNCKVLLAESSEVVWRSVGRRVKKHETVRLTWQVRIN